MNLTRFYHIIKKEFIHIKRDKASLVIAIIMPVMMLLLFGYAVKTEVSHVSSVILDEDNTSESRELIQKFVNSDYFNINYSVHSYDEMKDLINSGKAKAGILIPAGFGGDMKTNKKTSATLYIDGSDPTVARTALSSGLMIGNIFSLNTAKNAAYKKGMSTATGNIDLSADVWFNPELRSELFTIPGLIGIVMQNITIILTAFSLVRERERGTIEQLIVTPVKSLELILGKLVPYVLIGFLEFLGVLVIGTYWFKVPIRGSVPLLILLGSGFVICALAIGMLISTIAKTQAQAMQLSVLFLLPSVLLSGFMFPREAMPQVIQWIGYFIPVTYFLNILRGIILKGVGYQYLRFDIYLLCLLGLLLLSMAVIRFRKRLD